MFLNGHLEIMKYLENEHNKYIHIKDNDYAYLLAYILLVGLKLLLILIICIRKKKKKSILTLKNN